LFNEWFLNILPNKMKYVLYMKHWHRIWSKHLVYRGLIYNIFSMHVQIVLYHIILDVGSFLWFGLKNNVKFNQNVWNIVILTPSTLDTLYSTQVGGSWIFYQTKQGLSDRQHPLGLVKYAKTTVPWLRLLVIIYQDDIYKLKMTLSIYWSSIW
jgi:hypothetical protein